MNTSMILRSASLLILAAAALSAHGAPTLTLSPASYSVVRPTVGTSTLTVTGTISGASRLFDYGFTGFTGGAFVGSFNSTLTIPYIQAADASLQSTGTYTGPLFAFTFSPTTPLGLSTVNPYGNVLDSFGASTTTNAPTLLVNVVAAPVPEPATLAVFGLPALALLRRRRRA